MILTAKKLRETEAKSFGFFVISLPVPLFLVVVSLHYESGF